MIAINGEYSGISPFTDPKMAEGELYPAIAMADEGDIVSFVNPDDIFD